jgi:tripartite-type tricarboxylate transporter receptor subunit TctC
MPELIEFDPDGLVQQTDSDPILWGAGMIKRLISSVLILAAATTFAVAQSYPDRPLKLVVGFPPGGNVDTIARLLGQEMSKGLGQPIVIENRPGQAGALAAEAVVRAPPDGYTLLLANGAQPVTAALYKNLKFKLVEDFAWISTASFYPFVICVRKDSKFQNLRDLMKAAQSETLTAGTAGVGSIHHMVIELLALGSNAKFQHVPYRGEAPAVTGLLGGDVQFMPLTSTLANQYTQSGELRALAVTGRTRSTYFPNVPTVQESGVADYEVVSWSGLSTTAGTPPAIVERLRAELVRAINTPEVRSRLEGFGTDVRAIEPAEMRALVERQLALWTRVATRANLRLE